MKLLRLFRQASAVVIVLLLTAAPAMAQGGASANGPDYSIFSGAAMGAGLGAALTIIGAGYGMGRIGGAAMDGMARQPEVAGRIQTGMIIIAALLEGVTFFSLIVCIIVALKAIW